jgi:hypothetical protein
MFGFRETCNIDDSPGKLLDLIQSIPQFKIEMNRNQKFFNEAGYLYYLSSNDFLAVTKVISWIIGVMINIAALGFYKKIEIKNGYEIEEDSAK